MTPILLGSHTRGSFSMRYLSNFNVSLTFGFSQQSSSRGCFVCHHHGGTAWSHGTDTANATSTDTSSRTSAGSCWWRRHGVLPCQKGTQDATPQRKGRCIVGASILGVKTFPRFRLDAVASIKVGWHGIMVVDDNVRGVVACCSNWILWA